MVHVPELLYVLALCHFVSQTLYQRHAVLASVCQLTNEQGIRLAF